MLLSCVLAGLVALAQASPMAEIVQRAPEAKVVTHTNYVDSWVTVTATGVAPATQQSTPPKVCRNRHKNPPSVPSYQPPAPTSTDAVPVNTPQPAAPPASIPPPPADANSGLTPFAQTVIAHHNVHRQNHSAPDLVWDQALADTATKIGQTCVYAHSMNVDGGGYGQNIAAGAPASDIAGVITQLDYNQEEPLFEPYYGQETPDDFNDKFEGYGHFTQLVWVSTTSVGCAVVDCSASGLKNAGTNVGPYFTVCNYKPPGNYIGQFADNVKRGLGKPSITSNWPN